MTSADTTRIDDETKTFLLLEMTRDIVVAGAASGRISDLAAAIKEVHGALAALGDPVYEPKVPELVPAVQIRKSVTPDMIYCLEDGKGFKSLKRHLSSHYGMTPEEYRTKWGLPPEYPMVAPNYSATRSALAKSAGLGLKR